MKKIFFALMFFIISVSVFSEGPFQFRGFPLGAGKEEVITKEGKPDQEISYGKAVILFYKERNVVTYTAQTEFIFKDNKLIGGAYAILKLTEVKDYINAFADLENKLTSLYGTPEVKSNISVSQRSTSAAYIDQVKKAGPYRSEWKTNETSIAIELSFADNKSFFGIVYTSLGRFENQKKNTGKVSSTEGL